MPRRVETFSFITGVNAYITDFAEPITISRKVNFPPDVTETELNNIAVAVGATTIANTTPCPDDIVGASPRYLNFIRASGNTVSIPLGNRTNLITAATTIKGILDAEAGNNVVCIELVGEEFRNLNDIFGLTYSGTIFAKSHKAPDGSPKQFYISGTIAYSADAATTPGAGVVVPVKSITDVDGSPATQLGGEFTQCAGNLLSTISCSNGRRRIRKHRRYKLQFATKVDPTDVNEAPLTESIEVPVKDFTGSLINDCGGNLTSLDGLYCIGYQGESYKQIHNLL